MSMYLKPLDRVEILTLQDNYIDIAAGDGNEMIQRMFPLKDGEVKNTILAEHGFSALVTVSMGDQTRRLLFDLGFSEFGAAFNAEKLNANLTTVEAIAISHGHPDHTGGFKQLVQKIDRKKIPLVVHPAAFRHPRYIKITEDFKVYFPAFTRAMVREAGLELLETEEPYPLLDGTIFFWVGFPGKRPMKKACPTPIMENRAKKNLMPLKTIRPSSCFSRKKGWWSSPDAPTRGSSIR